MTGAQFRKLREDLGLTLRGLADRWDVDKRTVHREERKRTVRGLYRDAIESVKREHQNDADPE